MLTSSGLICLATHKTQLKFPIALGYLLKKRTVVANFLSSSKVLIIPKNALRHLPNKFFVWPGGLAIFFESLFSSHIYI